MLKDRSSFCDWKLTVLGVVIALGLVLSPLKLGAQTTISTGSIQGTISDPTGAVIPGAAITISTKETGQSISLKSSGSGTYSSGALVPGNYTVRVESKGFKTALQTVNVQVGVTSPGNVTLELGQETTVISVESSGVGVNTEQATVQGVLSARQIDALPTNGRSFLDLAAIEPGIQIQDGGSFDPTKNGYAAISVGGRQGRTTRIELDGVDITDETVGTTVTNVPLSAIQEFSIAQSSLDISTELTSSGAANIVSRSGSNQFHGEGFLYARSDKTSARYGQTNVPFDRQQYGGRFGGPLIKDRLFFFADWERTVQDQQQAVTLPDPFTALSGIFNSPYHESMLVGKLDWNIKSNIRAFYRWTYNQNNNEAPYLSNTYEPYSNRDNVPVQAAGLDVTMGSWSHTIRFGYTRFRNAIADSQSRKSTIDVAPGVNVHIGPLTGCTGAGDVFCSGINILAPQATVQHNTQFKYDGSKIIGSHIIRYGIGVNRILGGGYASFYSAQPILRGSFTDSARAFADAGPFPGGESNPLNYPVGRGRFGNGQGFFTEIPQFGYPAGGQFDTRFAWYFGDTWKARRNLTISYGVRYVRDTGRSDSDMPAIPLLNEWGAGLGDRVHQPNRNFAPQLGIAWDPGKNGKTVIRAGAGLYYENAIFNNILFDRPGRLPKGLFFGIQDFCPAGALLLPDGTSIDTSNICGAPIGTVVDQVIALQSVFQNAVAVAGATANPNYIGENYAQGDSSTGNVFIAPNYRTPFSWQFNIGVQRELKPGTILSVDYVRNVGLHYLLSFDVNHIGDSRYLNKTAAMNAIDATNDGFGCPLGTAGINCAIAAGATIGDYAGNGLDSGKQVFSGFPAFMFGATPDTGAAFPGMNPNLGEMQMLFPIGRSVYNALQVALRSNKDNPFRGVRNMGLLVTYSLSRFKSLANDQDFVEGATNDRNINAFFGPTSLDRTHQIGFGTSMDFPYAFRLAFNGRVATALPRTLSLPGGTDPGALFYSDWYGDGSNQGHVLPGTNIGSFGRDVKVGELNSVINSYNSNVAGTLTPAGQALVDAGLFTKDQFTALGGVMETVSPAPAGQIGNPPSLNVSTRFGWVLKPSKVWSSVPETFTIEPSISIFNLFNFANFGRLDGELNGGALSPNGTTKGDRTNRIRFGSGIFSSGGPRMFEWGIRVTF